MTTRVLVAKYIRDPRRWEPVNVGVIILRGDEAQARFLGERAGGSIDRRSTRHVVGDTEVFSEWVRYWRSALEHGSAGAEEILSRKTPGYWVAEQGEIWLDAEHLGPEELAERYYSDLVLRADDETDAVAPQLRQRVDQVLERAQLFAFAKIDRDALVEASQLDPPEKYKFHYVARNGRTTVGHRVSLETVHLHDALWKFSNLSEDLRRVAFVAPEEAPEELRPTLVHLRRNAQVIDVFGEAAVDQVREAFLS